MAIVVINDNVDSVCLRPVGIIGILLITDVEDAFVLNHKGFDETTSTVFFEIIENDKDVTNWLPQYWGQIRLPASELIISKGTV